MDTLRRRHLEVLERLYSLPLADGLETRAGAGVCAASVTLFGRRKLHVEIYKRSDGALSIACTVIPYREDGYQRHERFTDLDEAIARWEALEAAGR